MADFEPTNVVKQDRCEPQQPPPEPTPQQTDPCVGQLTGSITGTVTMENCCCCCPQLRTRTFIVPISPQTVPQLQTFMQNTVNSYEAQGFVVLAHSLTDTGAGWTLGLTIGWYA